MVVLDNVADIEEGNTSSTQQKETKEEERIKEKCGTYNTSYGKSDSTEEMNTYDVNKMNLEVVETFLKENIGLENVGDDSVERIT